LLSLYAVQDRPESVDSLPPPRRYSRLIISSGWYVYLSLPW
jgi:hypothetical protein